MATHDPQIVHRDSFLVIGIEARTSNAREMTSEGAIPRLWARLMQENLLAKIPNRAGDEVLALYTDYESDKNGAYTYLLGARVTSAAHVPEGMTARAVPAGEYSVFTRRGELPNDAVVNLWKQIWSLENNHQLSRAYRTDYEVHHFSGPAEKAVEIYVGLKNGSHARP